MRTVDGKITKIEEIGNALIWGEDEFAIHKKSTNILKHSKNIIDLIEVGDYVNEYKVYKIEDKTIYTDEIEFLCYDDYGNVRLENKDIKTIVTKEQFKNAEYRVEEE